MTEPHRSHEPDRTADVTQPRPMSGGAAGGGSASGPDADRFVNAEAAMGGADAVEKTTYVVGSGTEPEARNTGGASARARSGGGPNYIAWGAAALALVTAMVYVLAM